MPPSMEEGAPIISARALRWSDEEVSFVLLLSRAHRLLSCVCLGLVLCWIYFETGHGGADEGTRWFVKIPSHTYSCLHMVSAATQ